MTVVHKILNYLRKRTWLWGFSAKSSVIILSKTGSEKLLPLIDKKEDVIILDDEHKIYINPSERMNYIFNSSINGIENSDLILLVGANPRLEATILNARIRKAYIKNKLKIYSIGDAGDLTYPYKNIGSNTSIIKEIVSGSHEISNKIKNAKKPIIIIGDSALYGKSGKYVFETLKKFLSDNNFIKKDWNALNILTQQASRVGAIDLGVHSINETENFLFFDKLDNDEFKFIYL